MRSDTSSADYTTDDEGKVEVTLNKPGEYRVEAKKDGYIGTIYLNCGHQIINCRSGEPVDATIHVLQNGNPLFSGEVEVPTAKFLKDGIWVDNPTAMGALQETGVPYSISLHPIYGISLDSINGIGIPYYYIDGEDPGAGSGSRMLTGGEWITFNTPWSTPLLYLTAPDEVEAGVPFEITVTSGYSWTSPGDREKVSGATITIEGADAATFTTDASGIATVTLNTIGDYSVKADKGNCIGTYFLIPGGYKTIRCVTGEKTEVTIHVLTNGNEIFSGEVEVPSTGFTKNGIWVDNPTALGALEKTGKSYSISETPPYGIYINEIAGISDPYYYIDGEDPGVGAGSKMLGGGEWITFNAPWSTPLLYLTAPDDVEAGVPFEITVTSGYSWTSPGDRVPVDEAEVDIEGDKHNTGADGKATVTLSQTGIYSVKAEKSNYIGTYYLIPGGYHFITVTGESGLLSVEKIADRREAEPGDVLAYKITICNDYDDPITDVNVTDVLQMDSTFLGAEPQPKETSGNLVKWNFSEIETGGCEEITLQVKVSDTKPSGYILENCANVVAHNDTEYLISAVGCEEVFIGIREPLIVTKTADKESVERGEKVKYTIEVCNLDNADMTDLVVEDAFNKDVEFVSADPVPVQEYGEGDSFREVIWAYDSIKLDTCEEITLEVIVPEMQDFEFEMEQSVEGEGFVNAANDYSTTPPEYGLTNVVNVSGYIRHEQAADKLFEASASLTVGVIDLGTELSTREHGSGSYDSEELVAVKTEDKLIEMSKDVLATYATTTLGLYNN